MTKFYSLVAVAMFSVAAVAQTTLFTEDFDSVTGSDNTGTNQNIEWLGNENFPSTVKAYEAGGAVKIGTGSLVGSIKSKELDLSTDGGEFKVSFDVKGWTNIEGSIIVTVTGLPPQTVAYTAKRTESFETKTISFIGGTAGSTVTFATSAKRAFIDNIKVITNPIILGVGNVNAKNASLVKNTVVGNIMMFSSKADIQIVNMNGQVVKTACVNENTSLEVSSLAKGMYLVTANVNGKAVSQKIIKK